MTAAEQMVDMRFLRTLVPLGELDNEQMQHLMGHYTVELVESGKHLFTIGENDAYTYYVLSGQIKLHFRSGSEREVKAQTTQARYMLVPERPRTATATAMTTCTILKIEKDALDELVRWGDRKGIKLDDLEEDDSKQSDWMSHYLKSKVFLKLRAQNIQALMMKLEEIPVRAGQVIIRQGDDDGSYYIIKKGHCQVTRHDDVKDEEVELAVLTVGTGFGEEAIITHTRRGATVTMLDDGALMRISREDFRHLLVQPLIDDIEYKHALSLGNQVFLDVRSYEEYRRDGIRGAENIALMQIRPNLDKFNSDKIYVTYSDNGYAASAAAFLLCQQGVNAIVLRGGTFGIPTTVSRGNEPEDDIPVVDNVINLKGSNPGLPTAQETAEKAEDFLPDDDFDEEAVLANPKLQSLLLPENPQNEYINTEAVMNNPEVAALFNHARDRAEAQNDVAAEAGMASRAAQAEVARLRREAEAAKRELEKARKRAEQEVKQSAELARQLGAKQAEMEEAIRQAEEEAARAREAESERQAAYEEIESLKSQMAIAVENAKEEAQQSAEIIKQFVTKEASKQKKAAEAAARREAERARLAEEAQHRAQAEIERLMAEAETARRELQEHARQAAENARAAAAREARRVNEEARVREEATRVKTEAEMERMRDELAKSRAEAEAARVHAELQIEQMRAQAKQESKEEQAKARKAVEEAQLQNEQALEAKQIEINKAIAKAEESSFRTTEAERARDQALAEIELLRKEASKTQEELQSQLSEDIARSEIEHEVAKARAIELANKQSEIEEIARLADEQSNRAKIAENAQSIAESEIGRLKAEIQRLREQAAPDEASVNEAEKAAWQRQHQADIERKQNEIQAAIRQASQEAERAKTSERAYKQAEDEIRRLKAEMDIATRQAQAQLEADARRALQQQEEMERKAQVLAQKQAEIALAVERAEHEKRRAEESEKARREAEMALEKLKETAAANRKVMQELKRIRADAKDKEVAMRAADKRAAREAARAEKADRARKAAENEIKRLKQLAIAQHRKAEQAIKESMKTPKPVPKKIPAKPTSGKKEQNSAWISDQVLWETTLGMRDDDGAEEVMQPQEEDVLDEFKEILLTDIPLVPNKGAANKISPRGASMAQTSANKRSSVADEYDPFLDEPIVYRNSAERSAFQARDINRSVTPQTDAIAYIKRRRSNIHKIIAGFVVVALIGGGVAWTMLKPKTTRHVAKTSPTSSSVVPSQKTASVSTPKSKPLSIEERVLQKRKRGEEALRRERQRRAAEQAASARRPSTANETSVREPVSNTTSSNLLPSNGPTADDFNSVEIGVSEPTRSTNSRSFTTPKPTRPTITLRPQARSEPVIDSNEEAPVIETPPSDGAIPALVAPAN